MISIVFKYKYLDIRRLYFLIFLVVILILHQIVFLQSANHNFIAVAYQIGLNLNINQINLIKDRITKRQERIANVSVVDIDTLIHDHVQYASDMLSGTVNESLETTVECTGPLYNQSCLYKNLYYMNNTFMVLTIKGKTLPILTVRPNYHPYWDLTPTILEFASYEKIQKFVQNIARPMKVANLTVYFHELWYFNIGHMLFDGLYPAYLAVIRFAPKHLHLFRLLVNLATYGDRWTLDVCNRFSGLGIMRLDVLNNISTKKWFVFENIIMGSGNMCQRCIQPNAQLPGGIEMNGSRLFRDRMYKKHGLSPPVSRRRHSAQYRDFKKPFIVYIIDNKRFTNDDRKEIYDAMNQLNAYTALRITEITDNANAIKKPLINITFLNYSRILTKTRTSRHFSYGSVKNKSRESRFKAQLRILRSMDIHVTGPGTGQMYQTFLPDGSVTINLGGIESYNQSNKTVIYTSFMEQYMTAGTPYIKGLYYPINKRPKGLQKSEIIKLIEQAAVLISDGFTIPVNPRNNLAPDGQLFQDMCVKDEKFCTLVTKRSTDRPFPCLDLWFERLTHETAQWSSEGFIYESKNISCAFNHTLLHELRTKYGIDHYVK